MCLENSGGPPSPRSPILDPPIIQITDLPFLPDSVPCHFCAEKEDPMHSENRLQIVSRGLVHGRDIGRGPEAPYMSLPSPNVQKWRWNARLNIVYSAHDDDAPGQITEMPEDIEEEEEESEIPGPPASALTSRRRALVPPKMISDADSEEDLLDRKRRGSAESTTSNSSSAPRTRRSSVVVIPPMQICPGDLLVYSKVLIQRNMTQVGDLGGSTTCLADTDTDPITTRKGKAPWSLLKLFERGRGKSGSLGGLEEVLQLLQPSAELCDAQLVRYKGMAWMEFLDRLGRSSESESASQQSSPNQELSPCSPAFIIKKASGTSEDTQESELTSSIESSTLTLVPSPSAYDNKDSLEQHRDILEPTTPPPQKLTKSRSKQMHKQDSFCNVLKKQFSRKTVLERQDSRKALLHDKGDHSLESSPEPRRRLLRQESHKFLLGSPPEHKRKLYRQSSCDNLYERRKQKLKLENLRLLENIPEQLIKSRKFIEDSKHEDQEVREHKTIKKKHHPKTVTLHRQNSAALFRNLLAAEKLSPLPISEESEESDAPPSPAPINYRNEMKRYESMWDLFQSELIFLYDHLMVLKNVYMEPLKKIQVEGFAMFAEPELLFGNLDELCCVTYAFCKEFLTLLLQHLDSDCHVGTTDILVKLFLKSSKASQLSSAYHRYTLNYINALNYLDTLRRQVEFLEFEKWCNRDQRCKRLQLPDLLVAPVQHVMKLPLILKDIETRTQDAAERTQIASIIETQEVSLRELDDKMKWLKNFERLLEIQRNIVWPSVLEMEAKQWVPEFLKNALSKQPCERLIVSPRRQIIMEGTLQLLDSGKPIDHYVILFDDMLLITRRKKGLHKKKSSLSENWPTTCATGRSSSSGDSLFKYIVYKQPISLDRFLLHEIPAGECGPSCRLDHAFTLVSLNRFQQIISVHTFQSTTEQVKQSWLGKLRGTQESWKHTLENTVFKTQRLSGTGDIPTEKHSPEKIPEKLFPECGKQH